MADDGRIAIGDLAAIAPADLVDVVASGAATFSAELSADYQEAGDAVPLSIAWAFDGTAPVVQVDGDALEGLLIDPAELLQAALATTEAEAALAALEGWFDRATTALEAQDLLTRSLPFINQSIADLLGIGGLLDTLGDAMRSAAAAGAPDRRLRGRHRSGVRGGAGRRHRHRARRLGDHRWAVRRG